MEWKRAWVSDVNRKKKLRKRMQTLVPRKASKTERASSCNPSSSNPTSGKRRYKASANQKNLCNPTNYLKLLTKLLPRVGDTILDIDANQQDVVAADVFDRIVRMAVI
jgi:hypothetical protein